ncbi:MAG: hypothetical protein R2883_02970 [Caldisericia bacterium]
MDITPGINVFKAESIGTDEIVTAESLNHKTNHPSALDWKTNYTINGQTFTLDVAPTASFHHFPPNSRTIPTCQFVPLPKL